MEKEGLIESMKSNFKAMQLIMSIARRPLKGKNEISKMALTQRVNELKAKGVARLYTVANHALSGATASIFFQNLGLMIRHRTDVIYASWQQSSPLYVIPGVAAYTRKLLRNWLHQMLRFKVMVVLRLRLFPSKSDSIIEAFGTTSKWSATPASEVFCNCAKASNDAFDKLEGCVFTKLSVYLERKVGKLPPQWTCKTRMVPGFHKEREKTEEKFQEFQEQVEKKLKGVIEEGCLDPFRISLFDNDKVANKGMSFIKGKQYPALESRFKEVKRELSNFVIGNIDKVKEEGMVICPKR